MGVWQQWHQMDHMQTMCTSLQTNNHTNTSSLHFYRSGALSDAQPTVSESTEDKNTEGKYLLTRKWDFVTILGQNASKFAGQSSC